MPPVAAGSHLGGSDRTAAALAGRYGGRWRVGPVVGRARHSITHRRIRVEVRRGDWSATEGAVPPEAPRWASAEDLPRFATSSLVGKILAAAG